MDDRTWTGRAFVGVSLDGHLARRDGGLTWLTDPPRDRPHRDAATTPEAETWETFLPAVDHVVMGRHTYDTVAAFPEWPYGDKAVVVLSTTLPPHHDHRVEIARSLPEAATRLTAADARDVYVDGGATIRAFLKAGLLDELTVAWAPVLLGGGRPLFGPLDDDVLLTLRGSHVDADGLVCATYRVHRPDPAP